MTKSWDFCESSYFMTESSNIDFKKSQFSENCDVSFKNNENG